MDSTNHNDVNAYKNFCFKNKKTHFSNLCTKYMKEKTRFCGNYCHQKHDIFNRRCWRHKNTFDSKLSPVIILMIVSDQFYNKNIWLQFLASCEKHNVPIHLVLYNEYMYRGTVRHSQNLLSRFRPVSKVFLKKYHILTLKNNHAGIKYSTIYFDMLKYATDIPNANKCIVITEKTIPIRSPKTLYKTVLSYNKSVLDLSYNVKFSKHIPRSLPLGNRKKCFELVNNRAQCLYSVLFLKSALPTLSLYGKYFGVEEKGKSGLQITNLSLLKEWESYTASMLDEFWLLNSYIIHLYLNKENCPIKFIKTNVESSLPNNDRLVVADIPEWRDKLRRSFIFTTFKSKESIERFDDYSKMYYKELFNSMKI